ncbi:hypothetical protein ACP70R_032450 [Stipagrostis hirtigluma subsp. patula]
MDVRTYTSKQVASGALLRSAHTTVEMNHPDPASRWWCYPDNAGEPAVAAITAKPYVSGDYTIDDPLELVLQGGGTLDLDQPWFKPPPLASNVHEVPSGPPSEDEMAAWLYAIVKGEEHVADGRLALPKESSDTPTATRATSSTDKREKLAITEGMASKDTGGDSNERREMIGGARSSHYGAKHNLTEKRRRHKINERLKTLQKLVPGCDKQSNHASTLDQTIQYMKSLQKQVQAMSAVGLVRPTTAAAAGCPVVQPQYVPPGPPVAVAPMVLGPSPAMVPLGPMLPLAHYPAAVMMPAAPAPLMYPAAPAAPRAVAPAAGSHRQSSSSRGRGRGSSMR